MLTIICGEDIIAARKYFSELKSDFLKKNYNLQNISAKEVPDILKNGDSFSLFEQPNIYVTEQINTQIGRTKNDAYLIALRTIADDKNTHLVSWEGGKEARLLKTKTLGTVKEFKPNDSIFQLLDLCYPKNVTIFLSKLNSVAETQEEGFIYAMLCKHIRNLILAYENALPANTPPWQKSKLSIQAKKWELPKLVNFYEGLARIDVSNKTSSNVFGIKRSIELLACYFL